MVYRKIAFLLITVLGMYKERFDFGKNVKSERNYFWDLSKQITSNREFQIFCGKNSRKFFRRFFEMLVWIALIQIVSSLTVQRESEKKRFRFNDLYGSNYRTKSVSPSWVRILQFYSHTGGSSLGRPDAMK